METLTVEDARAVWGKSWGRLFEERFPEGIELDAHGWVSLIQKGFAPVLGKLYAETRDEAMRVRLVGVTLPVELGTALRGANLREADLRGIVAVGVNFRGADLTDANLECARLDLSDLTDAKLAKAKLTGATLRGATLHGADMTLAFAPGADFTRACLKYARAHHAHFDGAIMRLVQAPSFFIGHASLRWVDLTGADLPNVSAFRVNLYAAVLRAADLFGGVLKEASLYGADLSNSDLRFSNLTGADLTGANLVGAKVLGAVHDGIDLTGADFRDE